MSNNHYCNKPCICSGYLSYPLYLQKGKLVLRSLLSGGSLFSGGTLLSGFANTCDILSLLSEIPYFRGVVTFGTLREKSGGSHLFENTELKLLLFDIVRQYSFIKRYCKMNIKSCQSFFLQKKKKKKEKKRQENSPTPIIIRLSTENNARLWEKLFSNDTTPLNNYRIIMRAVKISITTVLRCHIVPARNF